MTAKKRKPNILQLVSAGVMLFCFSVYGICLIILDDTTPWKVMCCLVGIFYAAVILALYHGREDYS